MKVTPLDLRQTKFQTPCAAPIAEFGAFRLRRRRLRERAADTDG